MKAGSDMTTPGTTSIPKHTIHRDGGSQFYHLVTPDGETFCSADGPLRSTWIADIATYCLTNNILAETADCIQVYPETGLPVPCTHPKAAAPEPARCHPPTAGRWRLNEPDMTIQAESEVVAAVWVHHEYPEWNGTEEETDSKRRECLANGHVLAASLELLACLEETIAPFLAYPHKRLNMSAPTWQWFCRAEAAINKAKGISQ